MVCESFWEAGVALRLATCVATPQPAPFGVKATVYPHMVTCTHARKHGKHTRVHRQINTCTNVRTLPAPSADAHLCTYWKHSQLFTGLILVPSARAPGYLALLSTARQQAAKRFKTERLVALVPAKAPSPTSLAVDPRCDTGPAPAWWLCSASTSLLLFLPSCQLSPARSSHLAAAHPPAPCPLFLLPEVDLCWLKRRALVAIQISQGQCLNRRLLSAPSVCVLLALVRLHSGRFVVVSNGTIAVYPIGAAGSNDAFPVKPTTYAFKTSPQKETITVADVQVLGADPLQDERRVSFVALGHTGGGVGGAAQDATSVVLFETRLQGIRNGGYKMGALVPVR